MPTILVAEDAQFVRMRISQLLSEHNYNVVEAKDGEEAIQTYCHIKPDVVLMDVAMPVKDGLIALSEIRRFDPQAKIIMLTALSQHAFVLRAMQAGAKDFLIKPYDPEQLLLVLQKVLD